MTDTHREELIDLLMDCGEIVRVSVPGQFADDAYESIENALKRKEWWSVAQWDGANATYQGILVGRVNMGRVVGML